ncbi:hypothetical protein C3432_26825 [Citrobacter amalonaticus]|uniref:Amidohydrolase-related domain-containing protein n=1 Tax=Citrobacter amalonaticus TaxID=35703 RepID=A0A2S4RQY9_CITAM|nr:amidohydrolase family protein [Citrobacter amalonaticus]POT54622.1 hypothetical protein C3432_26825 [Citrobacter amalonaticus]POT69568.1 hypothetical protein C3436_26430 [Citrobacter amalonaticus]POU60379.1 hypothetical protein C3430_25350 [Citrobacter amalonaticus]POV02674.1 hypothetical protein C3424_25530 [Citrobacter amalonaticus]
MRFDTHAHVFALGLPLAENCRYVPDYSATPEQYLDHLDQHGIDAGILVQPSFLGTDNHYMLEALRRYPGRFYGVAVVDTAITIAEMQEMREAGVIGIRLNLIGLPLPDFQTAAWQTLLGHVNDLGWHVELHRSARDLPPLIGPLLAAGVKVVVDHFGLPSETDKAQDEGFRYLLTLAASRRVWVKISASYRNGSCQNSAQNILPLLPPLLAAFSPDRLLWGSDWPHTRFEDRMSYPQVCHEFQQWPLTEEQRDIILQTSAEQLIHQK